MSIEQEVHELPDEVKSVNIEEQKIYDGLLFPLILNPSDPFKDKDAEFWNDWVKTNLKVIEGLLFKYGAILFRGFPFNTPKEFDEFAKAYGYDPFINPRGGALRINVIGNVYTASESPPEFIVPLHSEMAQMNDYPYIVFFYCDIPAKEGGNTPIALSNVVYRKMSERDPDFVRRLEREGLRYSRVAPNGNEGKNTYGRSWPSIFSTSNRDEADKNARDLGLDFQWLEDGSMKITSEILPAIRVDKRTGKMMWFNAFFSFSVMSQDKDEPNHFAVNFPNGDSIRNESIEIMKEVVDEEKVSFKWQHTDVIMIDNRIALHSKDAYTAPPRRILVSFFQDDQGPI